MMARLLIAASLVSLAAAGWIGTYTEDVPDAGEPMYICVAADDVSFNAIYGEQGWITGTINGDVVEGWWYDGGEFEGPVPGTNNMQTYPNRGGCNFTLNGAGNALNGFWWYTGYENEPHPWQLSQSSAAQPTAVQCGATDDISGAARPVSAHYLRASEGVFSARAQSVCLTPQNYSTSYEYDDPDSGVTQYGYTSGDCYLENRLCTGFWMENGDQFGPVFGADLMLWKNASFSIDLWWTGFIADANYSRDHADPFLHSVDLFARDSVGATTDVCEANKARATFDVFNPPAWPVVPGGLSAASPIASVSAVVVAAVVLLLVIA